VKNQLGSNLMVQYIIDLSPDMNCKNLKLSWKGKGKKKSGSAIESWDPSRGDRVKRNRLQLALVGGSKSE